MAVSKNRIHQAFIIPGARARFTRKRDLKVFFGWIQTVDDDRFTLESSGSADCHSGEEFLFEINGKTHSLLCDAFLESNYSGGLAFMVTGNPKVVEADQQLRIQVDIQGTMEFQDASHDVQVMDVAPAGVGFLAKVKLQKGDRAKIEMTGHYGVVKFDIVVRNCRQPPNCPETWRIGAELVDPSRLDLGRHLRYFANAA